jgi:hypothetical protein
MVNRNRSPLRPEEALESCGPRFGEYPVSLLTRRSYNLQTDAVIDRRESAPNSLWLDFRSRPEGPDNPRET